MNIDISHISADIIKHQPSSPRPSSLQQLSNRFPPYSSLNTDVLMKLITLGDSGVGKTSFIQSLNHTQPLNCYTTIGVDMITKYVILHTQHIMNPSTLFKIHIWDTAGQEAFHSIITSYFRTVCGGFLVFDVMRPETLYNLHQWIKTSRMYLPRTSIQSFIVLGTKIDVDSNERFVSSKEGREFAQSYGFPYMECSPKQLVNVDDAFLYCIRWIWKRYQERNDENEEWVGIRNVRRNHSLYAENETETTCEPNSTVQRILSNTLPNSNCCWNM